MLNSIQKNHSRVFITGLLLTSAVLAQSADTISKRIVNIQGAPRGDLRKGPLTFMGSPVKAQVSSLSIEASQAVMSAPEGIAISDAKGKRISAFTGNVLVTRGNEKTESKLVAKGNSLVYSEETGQGVLSGEANAVFTPKDTKADPVTMSATVMSLDVDQNISLSTGNVKLTSGEQSGTANKLIFDEDKELAKLTGNPSLTRAAKTNVKELVITGQEVRALTGNNTLYIRGQVKLVQGSLITTGNAVYYDDKKNTAYVVGNAVSINNGVKQVAPASGYIEQRTDRGSVRILSSKFSIPTAQFKLRNE